MSLIEFVSRLVSMKDEGADDEGEDYDPHLHRTVEKPTSYGETMTHMLKGSIGAGILAMPSAMLRLGLVYGSIGLAIVGCVATLSIHVLIAAQYENCKRMRHGYMSYPLTVYWCMFNSELGCCKTLATFMGHMTYFMLLFWQIGVCCVYAVFIAENFKAVLDAHGYHFNVRIILCVLLIPLLLLTQLSDLKVLHPMSSVSNVIMLGGIILVFYYLMENDIKVDPHQLHIKESLLIDLPIFVGTALFALEAVGILLALEYNMKQPKDFTKCLGLFNIGMFVILSLYFIVGFFGYMKYGKLTAASLTLNLPLTEKKAQAAKIMFAVAILMSFPLQAYVAYAIIHTKILSLNKSEGVKMALSCLLKVMLAVIPWCLSTAIPKLGPFISLFGALCLSFLAIIIPGLLEVCLYWPRKHGRKWHRILLGLLLMNLGLVCLFSGVYTSIYEMSQ